MVDIHNIRRHEYYYQVSPDATGKVLIYGLRMIDEGVVNKYIELLERTKIYRGGDTD